MIRTQIQLPDELYHRAKAFAAERELSLAEMTRRGLELFLDRFPTSHEKGEIWELPTFDGGGILVPLEDLHDVAEADESMRAVERR
ncbi:MAG: hypothetical protein JNJ70_17805 [Verrucomicrobiales bacterium]|nr:hypothetical protein [Verrucomicrobiales bacterium]